MTAPSCTGPNPHGDLLSKAQDLSDAVAQGSSSGDNGKTPLEAVADNLSQKVFSVANSALRKSVIGPADSAVGPLLEFVDDALPREINIPAQNLSPEVEIPTLVDAFIKGFCEETYTESDIGFSKISQANAPLANAVAQGVRDLVHICARPADAASEGLHTEASVELIVNTIETIPLQTRKNLGLDTFVADLQNKVNGDPRALLSVLLQGTASIVGHAIHQIPKATTDRGSDALSHREDILPNAEIHLDELATPNGNLQDLFSSLSLDSSTIGNVPFQIPKANRGNGGEHLSSSQDVLSYATVPLPDLVLPHGDSDSKLATGNEKGNPKPSSSSSSATGSDRKTTNANPSTGYKDGDKSTSLSKGPASSVPGQSTFVPFEEDRPAFLDSSKLGDDLRKQLDEESDTFPNFDDSDRPADFEGFTGEFSVSFAPDRLAEAKDFTNFCAFCEKHGWPKAWLDYELKVRRNKIQHREEKVSNIDVDIKVKFQRERIHEAFANVEKAEQLHSKTKRDAYKISEAVVNYIVELEFLNRLLAGVQTKGDGKKSEVTASKSSSANVPGNKEKSSTAPKAEPETAHAPADTPAATDTSSPKAEGSVPGISHAEAEKVVVAKDTEVPNAAQATSTKPKSTEKPIAAPTAADVQALEAEIMAIDAKIETVGKSEQRANNRVKRYKKWWKKLVQKPLHKFFNARSSGTVVEEETILSELNRAQKVKLQKKKAALVEKLKKTKQLIKAKQQEKKGNPVKKAEETQANVLEKPQEKKADLVEKGNEVKNLGDKTLSADQLAKGVEKLSLEESQGPVNPPVPENTLAPSPENQQISRPEELKEQKTEGEPSMEATENVAPREDPSISTSQDTGSILVDKVFVPISNSIDTAYRQIQKTQKGAVETAKKVEEIGDAILLNSHNQARQGEEQFREADRLSKIANLVDKKLSESGEGVTLQMKNGQKKSLTSEQAQKLREDALDKGLTKVLEGTKNVIVGNTEAIAGSSLKFGAARLGKEIGRAHLTTANALGANAGGAVVDFIAEGKYSTEAAGEAAKAVVGQTVKGVSTQIVQNVARSAIKGAVREIAPQAVSLIPGVATINNVYAVSRAALSANTVEEGIGNGISAAVDLGISYGCAAAGQALIPIPGLGAFVGTGFGSLMILGKNKFVSQFKS